MPARPILCCSFFPVPVFGASSGASDGDDGREIGCHACRFRSSLGATIVPSRMLTVKSCDSPSTLPAPLTKKRALARTAAFHGERPAGTKGRASLIVRLGVARPVHHASSTSLCAPCFPPHCDAFPTQPAPLCSLKGTSFVQVREPKASSRAAPTDPAIVCKLLCLACALLSSIAPQGLARFGPKGTRDPLAPPNLVPDSNRRSKAFSLVASLHPYSLPAFVRRFSFAAPLAWPSSRQPIMSGSPWPRAIVGGLATIAVGYAIMKGWSSVPPSFCRLAALCSVPFRSQSS